MPAPARILLVNQFYPPDMAATGQLLADLAEHLAAQGLEVHVLCSAGGYGGGAVRGQPAPGRPDAPGRVCVHRVRATSFGRGRFLGRLLDYLTFYVLAFWTSLRLGRFNTCVCLTTPPFIALAGLALRRVRGTRLVLWSMDVYPQVLSAYGYLSARRLAYRVLAWLARRIYAACAAIIALGDGMSARLVQAGAGPARIVVVDNWVPGEAVRADPAPPGPDTVVMYSGNLGLGHQLETVLQAARLLADQRAIRFCLVGQGKMRPALEQQVRQMGLANVHFAPPVPLADLGRHLASAHLHLVSQRAGTQGLIVPSKFYGCLAAGRPILLLAPQDCDIAHRLRQSQAGWILPPDDAAALADAIARLAGDPALREQLGQNARRYYDQHLGRPRSLRALEQAVRGPGD